MNGKKLKKILKEHGWYKGGVMLKYQAHIVKDDGVYLVRFHDFENVITFGKSLDEALVNAEEALNGCLESDFERNFTVPEPSSSDSPNIYQIPVAPHIAVAIMLRKLRASRSQIAIARELDISYQVYQRLENPRKANPTIKTLEKVAKVFGKRFELSFV
jgi:antitoxin HicB